MINMFNLNQEVRGMMEKDTSRKLSQIVKYRKDNNLILQLPLTDRDGTPLPDDVTDSLHSVLRHRGKIQLHRLVGRTDKIFYYKYQVSHKSMGKRRR